jgi:hypothetical protein
MAKPSQVVLKLEGGLGNQLFQVAAGYFLAGKNNLDLVLDQYSIPLTTVHGEKRVGFSEFDVSPLPEPRKIILLDCLPNSLLAKWAKKLPTLKKLLLKLRMHTSNPDRLPLFIETNEEKSKSEFLNIKSPVKLHGNFQSWEIVEKATHYGFPKTLSLKVIPDWIKFLQKEVDFKESLVLHFRVGDDARVNHRFKQPEFAYYLAAYQLLKAKKNYAGFYLLSDDIDRVKEIFGNKVERDFQYLEMPSESTAAERMYVLSLFGGIVCANSTFCGWAAWTISNLGGAVVVPVPYSDGPVLGSRDFPTDWIKLDKYSGAEVI